MKTSRRLLSSLEDWIQACKTGQHTQIARDQVHLDRQRRLEASLPVWARHNQIDVGHAVPPGSHFTLFNPCYPEEEAGPDGGQLDNSQPPGGDYERLWAAGSFDWNSENPLRVGQHVQQTVTIENVQRKVGKTGVENIFVWQRRAISNEHGEAMVDRACRVFRKAGSAQQPSGPKPVPVESTFKPDFEASFTPSLLTLFRFSALTFNSAKLHFDHLYCTQVEHRPGVVVHGPLLSLLLTRLLEKNNLKVSRLDYRAISTLYVDQLARFEGRVDADVVRLQVTGDQGQLAMTAEAKLIR